MANILMSKVNDFIVFGAPDIREEEIQEVVDTLKSGWIGTGPKVKKFEHDFASYKGLSGDYALAVNSCTAALHLALEAAGIGSGDEVITTATTFCATVNAIFLSGAKPVLVDIDPVTGNIDTTKIESVITKKTKAIIPVHLAGYPCDMDAILQISNQYEFLVIEDCAHAIETEFKGKKAGTFGEFGCFSFYTTKNVVTAEGGMLIGKDDKKVGLARKLSLHGMDHNAWQRFSNKGYKHYSVDQPGFKYNMTDLNASLGIHQLARVDEAWLRRKEIYETYRVGLAALPILLPPEVPDWVKHAYHLFALRIDENYSKVNRDEFLVSMKNNNIGTGVHYSSLADYPFYQRELNLDINNFRESIKYGMSTVSLPLSSSLTDSQVNKVIDTVISILS